MKLSKIAMKNWVASYIKSEKKDLALKFIKNGSGRNDPCLVDAEKNVKIISNLDALTYLFNCSTAITNGKFTELNDIFDSIEDRQRELKKFNFEISQVEQIFKWLPHQPDFIIDESDIFSFCFKSENKYTYFRFDRDLTDTPAETPAIKSLLSNFTNEEAIRLWIGSLCFENSDRSQYLWLYGEGGNGKSLIGKILFKAFGDNNAKYAVVPDERDKFFTYSLVGKRLVIMDDTNKYAWVKSGLFKGITGNDWVGVERKFQEPMNAKLKCKFLFTSNEKPMISNDRSDLRRVIFSTSAVVFSVNPSFERSVLAEANDFILKCALEYQEKMHDRGAIIGDMSETDDIVEAYHEDAAHACDGVFEFESGAIVKAGDVRANVIALANLSRVPKKRIYDYLKFRGATQLSKKEDGVTLRFWVGLKILVRGDLTLIKK